MNELEDFALALGKIGGDGLALPEVIEEASVMAAETIEQLIQREFDAGRDPFGKPWAPLAKATLKRGRRPPPLTDTGAMRNSISVIARGGNLSVHSDSTIIQYHQDGTRNADGSTRMPQRKIFPDLSDPMPARWENAIQQSSERAFKKVFR